MELAGIGADSMKLGSLFDGSGGFPLAGAMHGIEPAWASEIEPYPIRVTTARFPAMKHLGDITKINGAEIEPVDIITFGSPCQDLSVAGKQAGLENGARSNLFYEAIRIIKEMRRATNGVYPRIAVWENVPGAYSSHGGKDFQSVLQAFASICSDAVIPGPPGGKWRGAGCIVADGWSVAWRTLDAQYCGVPQRRRRIYLVADFAGQSAGEILFKQEGLRGDSAESGKAGEGAAGDATGSVDGSVGIGINGEIAGTLDANYYKGCGLRQGVEREVVVYSFDSLSSFNQGINAAGRAGGSVLFEPMSALEENWAESSVKNALRAGASKSSHAVCYAIDRAAFNQGINAKYDICIEPELISSIVARGPSAVCYPIDSHQQDSRFKICEDGVCPTVPGQMGTGGNNGPMVLTKCAWDGSQICSTLTANNAGGNQRMPDKDNFNAVIEKVRKLNATDKKAGCREILLGLWGAYVEETLQRRVGEQQGIQQTEVLRHKVHGSALDEPSKARDKQGVWTCDCTEGSGCWVLRDMRESERERRTPQRQELPKQQPGELDADMSGLPQQATQGGEDVQDLRGEGQGSRILQQALHQIQEIWKPIAPQRKYIIRRLSPLECARLQGFPDWWEDGVPGADSKRYKMWGNGIALPCAAFVLGRVVDVIGRRSGVGSEG